MKRALATIVVGAACRKLHQLTGPRMEAYAKAIDAEYVVVRETQHKPPHYAKFDLLVSLAASGFEQVLYVDVDVYIRNHAPDIFATYTSAMFNEPPAIAPQHAAHAIRWIREHLDPHWPAGVYFNTGVIVIGGEELQQLATLLAAAVPRPGVYYEQDQLNALMREVGFPRQHLEQRWNQLCGKNWITPKKAGQAYFLHGTGGDPKYKQQLLASFVKDYP